MLPRTARVRRSPPRPEEGEELLPGELAACAETFGFGEAAGNAAVFFGNAAFFATAFFGDAFFFGEASGDDAILFGDPATCSGVGDAAFFGEVCGDAPSSKRRL